MSGKLKINIQSTQRQKAINRIAYIVLSCTFIFTVFGLTNLFFAGSGNLSAACGKNSGPSHTFKGTSSFVEPGAFNFGMADSNKMTSGVPPVIWCKMWLF